MDGENILDGRVDAGNAITGFLVRGRQEGQSRREKMM